MEKDKEIVMESEVRLEEVSSSRKAGDQDFTHLETEENNFLLAEEDLKKNSGYSGFSRQQFAELIKSLAKEADIKQADAVLRQIKPLYDELRERERGQALLKFTNDGGLAEDFELKPDDWDHMFEATARLIRDKKTTLFKQLESEKAANLAKKSELLERLRTLVDTEDTEHSLQHFKELQKEWKQVGPVPLADSKNLWANYTALVDRFYDHRSIYFELKELDRKKNLEAKLELCTKAEGLLPAVKLKDAISELNELHHEFKHIGPVPKEEKEAVWQRFKAASDAVYNLRDAHVAQLQVTLQQNLEIKEKICGEVLTFVSFRSDKIKEWNQKTQEILEIQKKWEGTGGVPRAKTKDLNKKFWSAFKAFFSSKSSFFKKLDEERDKNLQLKRDLITKALELKESQDWNKTANELKDLQRKWQELGPVPEKFREKIFLEFKEACDHFFEQRRQQVTKKDHEQEEALKQKEAICAELEQLAAGKNGSLDVLRELQNRYHAIGFVPKASISAVKARFSKASDDLLASLENVSSEEKERFMLEMQLKDLKDDPQAEKKIYHREQTIRKRITKVENDLAILRNNLEFFGRSKNAEMLKSEFSSKIKDADDQLAQLRKQLKMLKTVS